MHFVSIYNPVSTLNNTEIHINEGLTMINECYYTLYLKVKCKNVTNFNSKIMIRIVLYFYLNCKFTGAPHDILLQELPHVNPTRDMNRPSTNILVATLSCTGGRSLITLRSVIRLLVLNIHVNRAI